MLFRHLLLGLYGVLGILRLPFRLSRALHSFTSAVATWFSPLLASSRPAFSSGQVRSKCVASIWCAASSCEDSRLPSCCPRRALSNHVAPCRFSGVGIWLLRYLGCVCNTYLAFLRCIACPDILPVLMALVQASVFTAAVSTTSLRYPFTVFCLVCKRGLFDSCAFLACFGERMWRVRAAVFAMFRAALCDAPHLAAFSTSQQDELIFTVGR